jgi:NADPH:quinone reductase-like Zn-dependent oxidoreductase
MPSACVLTEYGPPNVLAWRDVPLPEPSERQIRIEVRVSGVGPTDLKIRRGDLKAAFPLSEPAVLGFETAGVVDAVGSEVSDVTVGDEVAALLSTLGGYGEYVLAAAWTRSRLRCRGATRAPCPLRSRRRSGCCASLMRPRARLS